MKSRLFVFICMIVTCLVVLGSVVEVQPPVNKAVYKATVLTSADTVYTFSTPTKHIQIWNTDAVNPVYVIMDTGDVDTTQADNKTWKIIAGAVADWDVSTTRLALKATGASVDVQIGILY